MGRRLKFGTAGIPLCAKGTDTVRGIEAVKKLGLEAMELEFVRSINISEEKAPAIRQAAKKFGIALTCHAPYYINLNAKEIHKKKASAYRIYKSAKITNLCGGTSVAFHPGYYLGLEREKVYRNVLREIRNIVAKLRSEDIQITIRPETTGKPSQFGSLKELLRLSSEVDGVMPCLDYAHLHARNNGSLKNYEDCRQVLIRLEKYLGKEALKNMHIQFSGVRYSEKGELNHLTIDESDLDFNNIVRSWREFNISGIAISESPNIEKDALKIKQMLE